MSNTGYYFTQAYDPATQGYWTLDSYAPQGLVQYPTVAAEPFGYVPIAPDFAQPSIDFVLQSTKKTTGSKNKSVRATQACEQCRYRKQRCDEGSPCSFCRANSLACIYRSVTPNKIEKALEGVNARMSSQSEAISALAKKIDHLEAMLEKVEHDSNRRSQPPDVPVPLFTKTFYEESNSTCGVRDATGLTIASWTSIRYLLFVSGATFDEDRIRQAEHRSMLSNQSAQMASKDGYASPSAVNAPLGAMPLTSLLLTGCDPQRRNGRPPDRPDYANLTPSTGARLVNGFLSHIGNQYPFLNAEYLRSLVQRFTHERHLSPVSMNSDSPSPSGDGEGRPSKRQRLGPDVKSQEQWHTDRSTENALVMLSCALGEVTLQKTSYPASSPPVDPKDGSQTRTTRQQVPGMDYFAAAMDMICDFINGRDLIHAQVFLLAGMYMALYMRMDEASSWYSMAGKVLSQLVRQRHLLEESDERHEDSHRSSRQAQDDLLLRTAWTCIHLESEIIPELRLPSSGLEKLASSLLVPHSWTGKRVSSQSGTDQTPGSHCPRSPYTAMVNLRRMQLDIQHQLYSEHCLTSSLGSLNHTIKDLASSLQQWRSQLDPSLQWGDGDHTPDQLPLAHLRYTYWECKLFLLRPFLDYAIHISFMHDNGDIGKLQGDNRITSHLWNAVHQKWQSCGADEVLSLAKLSVEAARQSLRAFDGVEGQLRTIPNVQSVAHGQFGNVMFLVAAQRSRGLRHLVKGGELQGLIGKTRELLRESEKTSTLMKMERDVLERVSNVFLNNTKDAA